MKFLAFNGSPRAKRSNTDRILQPFLEGARQAGAETETLYLRRMNINPCQGCFNCWLKTPGRCVQRDDMDEVMEKILAADVLIFATPLYDFTMTAYMKALVERLLPLAEPWFIEDEHGRTSHPPRYPDKEWKKGVLISNCGFPEVEHFEPLLGSFNRMFGGLDEEGRWLVVLKAAGTLLSVRELQPGLAWFFEGMRAAGREMVEQDRVSAETKAIIDRPLTDMSPEQFGEMVNAFFKSRLERLEKKPGREPEEARATPAEGEAMGEVMSIAQLMTGMPLAFNAQEAGDLSAIIQYHFTGQEPGDWFITMADGKCTSEQGVAENPTMTLTAPSEVWLAISRGELDGAAAFMQGTFKVQGDVGLLMRMNQLFSAGS